MKAPHRAIPVISALALVGLLASCSKNSPDTAVPAQPSATPAVADTPAENDAWSGIIDGDQRSAENTARDKYRHPRETLAFFGVTPTSTVVELSPGGGWYTELLAPYLREQGQLIVTSKDPNGPEAYYGTGQAKAWIEKQAAQSETFGKVQTVISPLDLTLDEAGKVTAIKHKPFELAPEGTVDVVLTFRSSHGWYRRDALPLIHAAAFKALKSGGVFGVVQHRANEGANPADTAKQGYLPEATVIEVAEQAGFKLADRSDINANPADTKDYENGVWHLPPRLLKGEEDKAKYLAIGESDRMTLKFVKP